MLIKIILSLSICLIISSITLNSPILIAFNILLVSIILSIILSIIISSWYAILIFLIYIGGIIVIFSYFIALTPNQTLKIKNYYIINLITIILIIPYILYFLPNININTNIIICYDLYCINIKPITLLIIIILLIILLIIVKLVKISSGPLRPFNYV